MVERRLLQTEASGRVILERLVLERGIETFVAYLREQRRHAEVGNLGVLEMPLEDERDLVGALRGTQLHGRLYRFRAHALKGPSPIDWTPRLRQEAISVQVSAVGS